MKLNELIAIRVFDVYEGKFLGTVFETAFNSNYTKLCCVSFFNDEEQEFFIKSQDIFACSDVLLVKNFSKITRDYPQNLKTGLIGKNVISLAGNNLGLVTNAMLDENFNVVEIQTSENTEIKMENIAWIDQSIIVGNIKKHLFKPKTDNKAAAENITASIMQTITSPKRNSVQLMPAKASINKNSLIGKSIKKDVFFRGNKIASNGQIVTAKTISVFEQNNITRELVYAVNLQ